MFSDEKTTDWRAEENCVRAGDSARSRGAAGAFESGTPSWPAARDQASNAVSRFVTGAQTARTSASLLTAYSSPQQTAASACGRRLRGDGVRVVVETGGTVGSTKSRSGTSTCDSSRSISATRSTVIRTLPGLLGAASQVLRCTRRMLVLPENVPNDFESALPGSLGQIEIRRRQAARRGRRVHTGAAAGRRRRVGRVPRELRSPVALRPNRVLLPVPRLEDADARLERSAVDREGQSRRQAALTRRGSRRFQGARGDREGGARRGSRNGSCNKIAGTRSDPGDWKCLEFQDGPGLLRRAAPANRNAESMVESSHCQTRRPVSMSRK